MLVPIRSIVSRYRWPLTLVATVAVTSSTTAAAVSYVVAGGVTSTGSTTTIRSTVNGAALQVTDTSAGANSKGIGITVPVGHAPISVSDGAGKATNLNADELDGIDASALARGKNVTILGNRTVQPADGKTHPLLALPGFGDIYTSCPSDEQIAETWFRNGSGHLMDVWEDEAGRYRPQILDVGGVTRLSRHLHGDPMVGESALLGVGFNDTARKTASLELGAFRARLDFPCGFQVTATIWSAPAP